jgi:hypothetical protein
LSDVNWSQVRADYEAGGTSLRQLAAKYGVSKTVIGERKFKEQWDNPKGRTADSGQRTADKIEAPIDTDLTPEKGDGTKEKQCLFLDAYARQANVMVAAKAAGISRQTVYNWLEHDQDFSFAYHQAKEAAKDVIRAEIFRRGHDGWDEPVYQMGYYAGTVHKYSDTLLIFHAKMLMPEYREKSQVDINAQVQHQPSGAYAHLSNDELDELERLWQVAEERRARGSN